LLTTDFAFKGEIVSRCVQDKGRAGGFWAIGATGGGSQEYYELGWRADDLPLQDTDGTDIIDN
jgi:hypothetical protein